MFISDAFAGESTPAIVSFLRFGGLWLPVLVVFLILFFFIIVPKQRKLNKKIEKIRSVKRGDDVVTTSGIYGKVKKMPTDDTVILEIAKGVEIKIKKIKIVEVL
jgi:preprotein translocase subunit YajC